MLKLISLYVVLGGEYQNIEEYLKSKSDIMDKISNNLICNKTKFLDYNLLKSASTNDDSNIQALELNAITTVKTLIQFNEHLKTLKDSFSFVFTKNKKQTSLDYIEGKYFEIKKLVNCSKIKGN
jgi:hypothetical protein